MFPHSLACGSVCLGEKMLILCDPMDCSPPGSSVHGIAQARILEWAAISSSSELSDPGTELKSPEAPALAGKFLTTSATWEAFLFLLL